MRPDSHPLLAAILSYRGPCESETIVERVEISLWLSVFLQLVLITKDFDCRVAGNLLREAKAALAELQNRCGPVNQATFWEFLTAIWLEKRIFSVMDGFTCRYFL